MSVIVKFKPKSESVTNFIKIPDTQFHENLLSRSQAAPCGQTNMRKLKIALLSELISIMCTTPFHIRQNNNNTHYYT